MAAQLFELQWRDQATIGYQLRREIGPPLQNPAVQRAAITADASGWPKQGLGTEQQRAQ